MMTAQQSALSKSQNSANNGQSGGQRGSSVKGQAGQYLAVIIIICWRKPLTKNLSNEIEGDSNTVGAQGVFGGYLP